MEEYNTTLLKCEENKVKEIVKGYINNIDNVKIDFVNVPLTMLTTEDYLVFSKDKSTNKVDITCNTTPISTELLNLSTLPADRRVNYVAKEMVITITAKLLTFLTQQVIRHGKEV